MALPVSWDWAMALSVRRAKVLIMNLTLDGQVSAWLLMVRVRVG